MFLAWHHPLWPGLALAALAVWVVTVFRYPSAWLFVVPAVLPGMNFAPWTGWIVFEELDLLLLGVVAAGHARLALSDSVGATPAQRPITVGLAATLAALTAVALARGFVDAGGASFGWFQGYTDPLNSLRAAKPVLFALLLGPLVGEQLRWSRSLALRRFALGMLAGLTLATLAAVCERAAYPGLWNFTRPYRTTALFWEMHVGGAAIDAYFALATPFVVWALWAARTPLRWAGAAVLALAVGYAGLTTFSRGLYAAAVVSLVVLTLLLALRRATTQAPHPGARRLGNLLLLVATSALVGVVFDQHGAGGALAALAVVVAAVVSLRRLQPQGWRTTASLALGLALTLEVVLVFGPGSFMLTRLATSERDSDSRWTHWGNGVGLLKTWDDWLFGIGLGRLPAHYAGTVAGREFPGAVRLVEAAHGEASVELSGPPSLDELGGLYRLTQRVGQQSNLRLGFDVRVIADADLWARVCEMHLLYAGRCQSGFVRLKATGASWQRVALPLRGRTLSGAEEWPPRQAVFMLSVTNAGGVAVFDRLVLSAADRTSLLQNGDFSEDLSRWLPSATHYFVPWHIDNLLLEILIERGAVTLLVLGALLLLALWRLYRRTGDPQALHPFLFASLAGVVGVGLLSSVFDVPRVAFLVCLIVTLGLQGRQEDRPCG